MTPPSGVPADASWDPSESEWRAAHPDAIDATGVRGQTWWPNGVPKAALARPPAGGSAAAFRFHPDGSVYRVGMFVDGVPHGTHRTYRTDGPTTEYLRPCCVPPGAWQLVQTFERGRGGEVHWFDRSGVRILDSGAAFPDRPPDVPGGARYHERGQLWEAGISFDTATPSGTRRRWDARGVLRLEEELRDGKPHGWTRLFDDTGRLCRAAHYQAGVLEGLFREDHLSPPPFRRAELTGQVGRFEDGQPVGRWEYLMADGRVACARELGQAVPRDLGPDTSPALEDVRRGAGEWQALAEWLERAGRHPEALLAAARAAAGSGDVNLLLAALERLTMPLDDAHAEAQADRVIEAARGELAALADGFRHGATPARVLLAIARTLSHADGSALDLATAACLLEPSSTDARTTRALVLGSLGDPEGARRELCRAPPLSEERAQFLGLYLDVYFPRFDFWPAAERLSAPENDALLPMAHDLRAVREVIGRLATRLMWIRGQLREQLAGEPPFLPPDLSALLPGGPVPLRRWAFTMSTAEYSGEEAPADDLAGDSGPPGDGDDAEAGEPDGEQDIVELRVDEALGLPPPLPRPGILALMRRARADWAALTWLCWAAGLSEPGLPERLDPPATFSRAAVMAVERTWRCHDKVVSSGMVALTRGVPGFDWAGTAIDFVPAVLAELALEEYLEVRAVFSWLCDPANQSPWQDDLRQL